MKNFIRFNREKADLNQTEFAKRCKVSRQTIHAIETGTFNPSVILALKMARELKIPLQELFKLEAKDE
ncbi:MAG: helix-turn-helix transcriptional regulator [Xanthomonadaceae bacterium]|nr:helix-turn-helix transcriptional regulator [Xanthomonadaceae bacterium]